MLVKVNEIWLQRCGGPHFQRPACIISDCKRNSTRNTGHVVRYGCDFKDRKLLNPQVGYIALSPTYSRGVMFGLIGRVAMSTLETERLASPRGYARGPKQEFLHLLCYRNKSDLHREIGIGKHQSRPVNPPRHQKFAG
ncbi:hypothetical protein EVAR_24002_1 [Eumeta japonica]|uniref:Uncharacterized protein n=1 Tax=Eumeta variegata TaxID=151549 RepID=A0A4C1WB97_EUMVA|nr:hypothetical protein EVAR_24002_1 [Eumeta japonica]